ncbi:MAG: hypothetical protein HQK49_12260 [Oligoflexia bacterium]|nr:hypothetical protein [Oligoflexia bacterium]
MKSTEIVKVFAVKQPIYRIDVDKKTEKKWVDQMLIKFNLFTMICFFILFVFSFFSFKLWAEDKCLYAGWPSQWISLPPNSPNIAGPLVCEDPLKVPPENNFIKELNQGCKTRMNDNSKEFYSCNPIVYGIDVCIKIDEDSKKDLEKACLQAAKQVADISKIPKLILDKYDDNKINGVNIFNKTFLLREELKKKNSEEKNKAELALFSKEMDERFNLIALELKDIYLEKHKNDNLKDGENYKKLEEIVKHIKEEQNKKTGEKDKDKDKDDMDTLSSEAINNLLGDANIVKLNLSIMNILKSNSKLEKKIVDSFTCHGKGVLDARFSGLKNALEDITDEVKKPKKPKDAKKQTKKTTVKGRIKKLIKNKQQVVWCMNRATKQPILLHHGDVWGRANEMVRSTFNQELNDEDYALTSRYHFAVRTDIPGSEGVYHLCDFSFNGTHLLDTEGKMISDPKKRNGCKRLKFSKKYPVRSFMIGRQIYICKPMENPSIINGEKNSNDNAIANATTETLKELAKYNVVVSDSSDSSDSGDSNISSKDGENAIKEEVEEQVKENDEESVIEKDDEKEN